MRTGIITTFIAIYQGNFIKAVTLFCRCITLYRLYQVYQLYLFRKMIQSRFYLTHPIKKQFINSVNIYIFAHT